MRPMEYKEVNGYIVRKEINPKIINRDGYAKACYRIYKNIKDMQDFKPISYCYTMKEVKEIIKEIIKEM